MYIKTIICNTNENAKIDLCCVGVIEIPSIGQDLERTDFLEIIQS